MKEMPGREIITRIITHDAPPRFGVDFIGDNPCDFIHCAAGRLINPRYDRYGQWGGRGRHASGAELQRRGAHDGVRRRLRPL